MQVENLPARKKKLTSKDMKKVKGGLVLGNVIGPNRSSSK